MTKDHCLTIEKMPEGGFVVFEGRSPLPNSYGDPHRLCGPLFACTDIGEALAFVRGKLDPPNPAANQALGGLSGAAFGTQGAILRGDKFKPAPGSTGNWNGA